MWRIARRNVRVQRLGHRVFVASGANGVDVVSVPSSFIDEIGSSVDGVGDEAVDSSASGAKEMGFSPVSDTPLG